MENMSNNQQQGFAQSSNPANSWGTPNTGYTAPTGYTATPGYGAPKKEDNNDKIRMITILLVVVLILNILSLGAMLLFGGRRSAKDQLASQKSMNAYTRKVGDKCISVDDLEAREDGYSTYIYGTVENTSRKDLRDVTLKVECYDSDDEFLGVDYIYINDMDGEDEVDLKEYCSYDDVEEVKLIYAEACYAKDVEP